VGLYLISITKSWNPHSGEIGSDEYKENGDKISILMSTKNFFVNTYKCIYQEEKVLGYWFFCLYSATQWP
jgi:hypothetical protein